MKIDQNLSPLTKMIKKKNGQNWPFFGPIFKISWVFTLFWTSESQKFPDNRGYSVVLKMTHFRLEKFGSKIARVSKVNFHLENSCFTWIFEDFFNFRHFLKFQKVIPRSLVLIMGENGCWWSKIWPKIHQNWPKLAILPILTRPFLSILAPSAKIGQNWLIITIRSILVNFKIK